MKKLLTMSVVACLAVSIFAIDFAVGGGVDYTLNLGKAKAFDGKFKKTEKENFLGVNAFFDATYLRLGIGTDIGVGGKKVDVDGSLGPLSANVPVSNDDYRKINLNLTVVGKYPFKLGIIHLFPMIGVDFAFNVSEKDGDVDLRKNAPDKYKADLNNYYFIAGLGADINFGKIFISPTATFGIDLKKHSSYENWKKLTNDTYRDNNLLVNIGLGIGYKF